MPYRMILLLMVLAIVPGVGIRAVEAEPPSNDSSSSEPFGELQPFDLSKRAAAPAADSNGQARPNLDQANQGNPKVTDKRLTTNDLGDPERIKIEGVSLFPEEQLRTALSCDSIYQAAARPSNDISDFLATLENRLTDGYRNSGCPNAKVRAGRDNEQNVVVLHIDEGKRVRKGRVIVKAPPSLDEKRFVTSLTTRQRTRQWQVFYGQKELPALEESVTLWKQGESLSYTQKAREDLDAAIRLALIDHGFPFATVRTVVLSSDSSGTADLQVDIGGDLSTCPITAIEVDGLKRDSRDLFLQYLGIKEGTRADGQAFDSLCAKLTHSCRYWSEKITVEFPTLQKDGHETLPAGAKLKIAVIEFAPMPPLDKPLDEVDEVLRKTSEALNETTPSASWGDAVLEVDFVNVQNSDSALHIRSVFNIDHGIAFEIKTRSTSTWHLEHSFIFGSGEFAAIDWQAREQFQSRLMTPGEFHLTIRRSTNDNGEPAGCMMFGWTFGDKNAADGEKPRMWKVQVDPAEIVHTAHRPEYQSHIHDGVLTITGVGTQMDFDAPSGRFISSHGTTTQGMPTTKFDLHFEQRAFENTVSDIHKRSVGITNHCDSEHVLSSGADFLLHQLAKQPAMQNDLTLCRMYKLASFAAGLPSCRQLLQKCDVKFSTAVTNKTRPIEPNDISFTIPSSLPEPKDDFAKFVTNVIQFVPFAADKTFPRGSWPWTLSREAAFTYLFSNSESSMNANMAHGAREVDRNVSDGQMGPLGTYLFIKGLQTAFPRVGGSGFAAQVGNMARNDLSDAAFEKDVSVVASEESGLSALCRDTAEALGKMPDDESRQLITCFPDCWQDPLQRLVMVRKSTPNEPCNAAIKEALLESWHHGLRDAVDSDLGLLCGGVEPSHSESATPEQIIEARAPSDRP